MFRIALHLSALSLLCACNPFSFHDLEDEAPVRSYSSDQALFGQQLSVFTDSVNEQTWLAASSRGVSRYQVYKLFGEGGYSFTEGREGCAGCDSTNPFDVAAVGFARSSSATRNAQFCVITPFNGSTNGVEETGISIDCDIEIECGVDLNGLPVTVDRCNFKNTVTLSSGAAIVSTYGATQPYAQALISDPETAPYLFRLSGRNFVPVDFVGTAPADGYGEQMSSKAHETGTRLVASQQNQVHVHEVDGSGATAVGCLDVGEKVRAVSWINDSVVVGTRDRVTVFPLSSFATPCAGTTEAGITCSDLPNQSYSGTVACAGLGEAVSAADVDGDGMQELIIGAPLSEVGNRSEAGAVFIVPNEGASPGEAAVLVDAEPKERQNLGASVLGVPVYPDSGPREEIAAGAPGGRNWRLFFCSDVPGDDGDPVKRCAE